ncbi:MAG TPA: 30S ribosomal protein S1 [Acidobacteriaceae bacterium]|jgi:small subunit ribosomal protein S1|nr:30S ribosomal protein S1 [Acidobacteriaceae bacterium]
MSDETISVPLPPAEAAPTHNETAPSEAAPAESAPTAESSASFGELLKEFEQSHRPEPGAKQLEGTVVSLGPDAVYLDIGFKTEGMLPKSALRDNAESVKAGDKFYVSVKGRNEEHYYVLSLARVAQPRDWTQLEEAFAQKLTIPGTVTGVVKGGLSVDVGVRAFLPASRSGTRDAAEMEKLVGQEITCRITQLDVADENVIVDRRSVLEEEALAAGQSQLAGLHEGAVVQGKVSRLASFGAFVDLGGIDGLLHVSDIAWSRVGSPEEVLEVGQTVEVKVLKIDRETRRISLGLKQLQPEPWETATERYRAGERITARVTRLTDFGAFVELEPGIEGLIHVSEMSWVKKVRRPSDILKVGDTVEVVILSLSPAERRMSLGLKQALGDPWADAAKKFPAGSAVEGKVTRMEKFGAFVQMAEGVEGLVHISEITAERRLAHPQDALKVGQVVRAQVLALDAEKRQAKLSMKQLVPTSLDEYLEEHNVGDAVSGRVVEVSDGSATVELGQGILAPCRLKEAAGAATASAGGADLSALTSLLQAKWKGSGAKQAGGAASASAAEPLNVGQVRSFRIVELDREAKRIVVELG